MRYSHALKKLTLHILTSLFLPPLWVEILFVVYIASVPFKWYCENWPHSKLQQKILIDLAKHGDSSHLASDQLSIPSLSQLVLDLFLGQVNNLSWPSQKEKKNLLFLLWGEMFFLSSLGLNKEAYWTVAAGCHLETMGWKPAWRQNPQKWPNQEIQEGGGGRGTRARAWKQLHLRTW